MREEYYSGVTRDTLTLVKALAERMVEADLAEANLVVPFNSGDTRISMKRKVRGREQ